MPTSTFETLLSPLDLGRFTVRNRLVMGSMHVGLEDSAGDVPQLAAYFEQRARGGVGMIVTGGYSPDRTGRLTPHGAQFTARIAEKHRMITRTVHEHDGRILLQLLHAGRYAFHPLAASASSSRSPISPFRARGLTGWGVRRTIADYAAAAARAIEAGYDGVELMGSEGYLLNQFLAPRTNHRRDRYGRDAAGRREMPLALTRAVRAAIGEKALLSYRISLLDLVEDGQDWDETIALAHSLVASGADVLSTGIGWHEARVPTIVTSVPRGAFVPLTARLRAEVDVPVIASNRVHDPALAEDVIARGDADLVSMARPFLADPELPRKLATGHGGQVVACISCNQACLDRVFVGERASCLVNPHAGHESDPRLTLLPVPMRRSRRVAVVGAGPAGLEAAVAASSRGHTVTLFEAQQEVGGQFLFASRIPGKEDYALALESWRMRLPAAGVGVRLGVRPSAEDLAGFDDVVIATGVVPRTVDLPGFAPDGDRVLSYAQLLGGAEAGERVAVIGAGGIGVDVSQFLTVSRPASIKEWQDHWGIADPDGHRGGLGDRATAEHSPRTVHLLQRKHTKIGAGLGRTTGWVHRAELRRAGIIEHKGVSYRGIERTEDGSVRLLLEEADPLEVDTVVVCAGQESERSLAEELAARESGPRVMVIGGADVAAELDAERAIRQAVEAAAAL